MNKTRKKLVAAMSGGVDSSVAAALFCEQGFDIVGVTLKMRSCDNPTEKRKSCCGIEDDLHARNVASKLGIPHYFLNVKDEFEEKVLRKAWDEYNSGKTPNPCAICNRHLKFGALLDYALKIGAEGIITGHYSIIDKNSDGSCELRRGVDRQKDQSYFLFALTQHQLSKSYMPLGGMTKSEVREKARHFGLSNAEKKESQDACFGYRDETFAQTLRKLFDGSPKHGFIRDMNDNILGEHDGIHQFTIGQRKGIGIALGVPAFVSKMDYMTGDVFLSSKQEDLLSDSLTAAEMNWQIAEFANSEFECEAQIRYRGKAVPAKVTPIGEGKVSVIFKDPLRAVTPGQAVVFYDGDRLIGGGWID